MNTCSVKSFLWLWMTLPIVCSEINKVISNRSFVIDYKNDQFLKDGSPFRYVSGSIHYFRVPRFYWEDRLTKLASAGLNTVQTYIEWSSHEPQPGEYKFVDDLDFISYVKLAQKLNLFVILRAGPFIGSERDMGGLPSWLLKGNPHIRLRSSDPVYLKYVDEWYAILLPLIKPLLYENGGPVIAIQVENEYGNYFECDKKYMGHLRDLFRQYLGDNVVLFTTDAARDATIKCGSVEGIYSTVDFEPERNVTDAFATMRRHQPTGPLVNSELYTGWLDLWTQPHSQTFNKIETLVNALDEILSMNASVNLYMFHGGTNFNFGNGAVKGNSFQVCPTSYDYNAPLTEAGDPTKKLYAVKNVILKHFDVENLRPIPPAVPKAAYGAVKMKLVGSLFRLLPFLGGQVVQSQYPMTFEDLGLNSGFVLYETKVTGLFMNPSELNVTYLRDRATVFVDEEAVGILNRQNNIFTLPLRIKSGQKISLFVENQGRISAGPFINDSKGIVGNVTLDGRRLTQWTMTPVAFNVNMNLIAALAAKTSRYSHRLAEERVAAPAAYTGTLLLPAEPQDTFLRLDGWSKGLCFINNFLLGRYWPSVGPQMTLYVPKTVLKPPPYLNRIMLFELEEAPCHSTQGKSQPCVVQFTDTPDIDGPTPYKQF